MSSRKRKALSLKDKLRILKEVDNNSHLSKVDLAKKLDMPVSTLTTVIYKRKAIEDNATACGSSASKTLRVQDGKFIKLEEVLLQFFNQCRAANIPVSGPLLMEKAKEIALKMDLPDSFCASSGWLHKFKKRHGISGKSVCGESGAVDNATVEEWKDERLLEILNGYDPKNVYNADETGLFYHLLPSKTLAMKNDTCHGGKKSKERLTVLLCANADGSDKLTPLVIGKSVKPRCFKNVKSFPTQYTANKKAWVNTKVFSDWLKAVDSKMALQKRKILLFIDQCPAHPPKTDFLQNVEVKFFPANCTSKLQPLDLGIIEAMKRYYRKRLLHLAIENLTNGNNSKMKINVLQAMNFIEMSWRKISAVTIQKCFTNAGFKFSNLDGVVDEVLEDDVIPISNEDWIRLGGEGSFEDYVTCDTDVATTSLLSVDELIENRDNEVSSEEETDEVTEERMPTFSEALTAFDIVRSYFTSHDIDEDTKNICLL